MGMDREAKVYYGWMIEKSAIMRLCEEREEVTHEEPRFDPITGEPADPAIIVDEEEGCYWHGKLMNEFEMCDVLYEWMKQHDIGLDVLPMQWADGGFCQIMIGINADDMELHELALSDDQAKFITEHFKVTYKPRIAAFMDVC